MPKRKCSMNVLYIWSKNLSTTTKKKTISSSSNSVFVKTFGIGYIIVDAAVWRCHRNLQGEDFSLKGWLSVPYQIRLVTSIIFRIMDEIESVHTYIIFYGNGTELKRNGNETYNEIQY